MNEGTETKRNVTKGQLETVAECLEALGIKPTHWGDTVFGRLLGMSLWVLTICSGCAIIICALKGR